MKTKQVMTGAAIAAVLALASPVYAAHLGGGVGGNFGGSLGGGLGNHGAGAGFASQGGLNSSVNSGTMARATGSKTAAAGNKTAAAGTTTAAAGATTAAAAKPATSANSGPKATPSSNATPSKPTTSANVAGASDATAQVGNRTVSGDGAGSLGVEHSAGATSAAAGVSGETSLN
jgi:hypothetical protein